MNYLQETSTVVSTETVARSTLLLGLRTLSLAPRVKPGQFLMLGPVGDGLDPFLNRPFSVHRVEEDRVFLLIAIVGRGTERLKKLRPGDSIGMLGPLGSGFEVPEGADPIIAVGGGMGVAPLFFLLENSVRAGARPTLLYGASSADQLVPTEILSSAGIEVQTATDDGSAGFGGTAADLLDQHLERLPVENRKNAYLAACGPGKMLEAVADICARYGTNLEVSLENRMACGVGACLGCTVFLDDGKGQRVCKEGPVFPSKEVFGK